MYGLATYVHTDHLGTPRFGTNSSGTQVWAWNNDAFGVSTPSGSVTINLGMPGQYYDSESGLFYNWNRYYNPAIGRYLSSDPIGIWGDIASGLISGPNSFGYAGQNPANLIDPLGQDVYVRTADGSVKPFDTAYGFYHYVDGLPNGSITNVTFFGDASWNLQGIMEGKIPGEFIRLDPDGQVMLYGNSMSDPLGTNKVSLGRLLAPKLATGSTITLAGCDVDAERNSEVTGTGPKTITQAMSQRFNRSAVSGSDFNTIRAPGSTTFYVLGDWDTYAPHDNP